MYDDFEGNPQWYDPHLDGLYQLPKHENTFSDILWDSPIGILLATFYCIAWVIRKCFYPLVALIITIAVAYVAFVHYMIFDRGDLIGVFFK